MKVLRTGNEWQINIGDGMAKGLYNASSLTDDRLTAWFNLDQMELLNVLKLTKKGVDKFCEEKL